MKIRYIILFFITASLAIGGVLVYIGHDNSNTTLDSEKTSKASDVSSTKSAVESSSIDETISASGTDYKITTVNGLGGVFAKPVAITKILNEKTALDIIASIPNFNHYKLTSIVNNGDQWNAKINVQGVAYEVTLSHYQGTMGIISLTEGNNNKKGYGFRIPDSLYDPYRNEDKKIQEDFAKTLSSSTSSANGLTESEAVDLANKYVTGSVGANKEPFKFYSKSGDSYILRTDIKKGTNGASDVAAFATVKLADDSHVQVTANTWVSSTGSHAPFYDKDVPR